MTHHWATKGPQRRGQGNGKRNASRSGPSRPHNNDHHSVPQGNGAGAPPAPNVAPPPAQPPAPSNAPAPAPSAAPAMRYGPTNVADSNPTAPQSGTFWVQLAADS